MSWPSLASLYPQAWRNMCGCALKPSFALAALSEGLLFAEALRQFYNGEADPRTLKLLRHE